MPEFILDHGSPGASARYRGDLSSFAQGYVEAMFFTSTGTGDDAENDLEHATLAELSPRAWDKIKADCAQFLDDAKIVACVGDRDEEAGRDFWYTRNGHGCGFWDGDWPEPDSEYLDLRASSFRETNLYRGDDGLLYLD